MQGFGPHTGDLIRMDLIIAGKDVVAVDAVASETMGYQAMEIPTTQIASKQHLGVGELSKIEIKGEKIETVKKDFRRPHGTLQKEISQYRVRGRMSPLEMVYP